MQLLFGATALAAAAVAVFWLTRPQRVARELELASRAERSVAAPEAAATARAIAAEYGSRWRIETSSFVTPALEVGARLVDYYLCRTLAEGGPASCADPVAGLGRIPYAFTPGYDNPDENARYTCSSEHARLRLLAALLLRSEGRNEACRVFRDEFLGEDGHLGADAFCAAAFDAYASGGVAAICPALDRLGYRQGDVCRRELFPAGAASCYDPLCRLVAGVIDGLEARDPRRCPWQYRASCGALLKPAAAEVECGAAAARLEAAYRAYLAGGNRRDKRVER